MNLQVIASSCSGHMNSILIRWFIISIINTTYITACRLFCWLTIPVDLLIVQNINVYTDKLLIHSWTT